MLKDTKPEPTKEPAPVDWLEGESPIPPEGEPATARQWLYWLDKRDKREAQQ
jgi:hypothetical protein